MHTVAAPCARRGHPSPGVEPCSFLLEAGSLLASAALSFPDFLVLQTDFSLFLPYWGLADALGPCRWEGHCGPQVTVNWSLWSCAGGSEMLLSNFPRATQPHSLDQPSLHTHPAFLACVCSPGFAPH